MKERQLTAQVGMVKLVEPFGLQLRLLVLDVVDARVIPFRLVRMAHAVTLGRDYVLLRLRDTLIEVINGSKEVSAIDWKQ